MLSRAAGLADLSAPDYTVLGASGFLGSALVGRLRASGANVRAVGRDGPQNGLGLDGPLGQVYYAIGITSDFRRRPFDTMDAHVTQVTRLLREGEFTSLTYLSSTRVYEEGVLTLEDAPVAASPERPSALYNISKLAGEAVCLSSGRENVRVARLSNVVGDAPGRDTFLDQIVAEGIAGGKILLRTQASSAKDYIALSDVLDLLVAIASRGSKRIYNVASGVQTSHQGIAQLVEAVAGWPVTFKDDATVVSFPPIETIRIRSEFAFVPQPFERYFPEQLRRVLGLLKEAR